MQKGRERHVAAPALLYAGRRRGRRAYQRREVGAPVRRRGRAVRSVSSAVASTAGGNAHSGIRAASQAAAAPVYCTDFIEIQEIPVCLIGI